MLQIKGMSVRVENREILYEVSLEIKKREIVSISGANGGGKSTLAQVLMGCGGYKVVKGDIEWEGRDIVKMSIDERAREGIFLAYQNPVAIPGVKVFNLCKMMYELRGNKIENVVEFKNELERRAERVGLTKSHITRNVNEGFSGGERKRLELLQLLLLRPKLAILDEVDSGLDEEGRKLVTEIIQEMGNKGTAFLVISHYKELLQEIKISKQLVIEQGELRMKN